jgi:hypothetical protein
VSCVFTNTFVPGESQAVGGIMGLIDGADGGATGSGRHERWFAAGSAACACWR